MEITREEAIEERTSEDLLSFDEAVKYLDTSKSTLYRLLNQEDVKGVKVGKQWRFRIADLAAYLERSPVAAALNESARADLDAALGFFRGEWLRTEIDLQQADAEHSSLTPEGKTSDLAELIVKLAISSKASDIHIRPTIPY